MKRTPSSDRSFTLMLLMLTFNSLILLPGSAPGASGILRIKDGYFWDSTRAEYFVPRGVAYQIWNPPVGANQTFAQVTYDLTEFRKIYANSVRCELVWSQLQIQPDHYDWSKSDFLVGEAERLGLRLFVLIGFQYPPEWFPKEWRGLNDRGEVSDVLNYEHPDAQKVYQGHIAAVVERYKNSPAIAAWILGNEFAYFDLWEDPAKYPVHRFLGYDAVSQSSFRRVLAKQYNNDIQRLNTNWKTNFSSFDAVKMPIRYPTDRHLPGYHDLIQWRKTSIGNFVAGAARAARAADTNHLITYSMVGGIFNGTDANNSAEDAKAIVDACRSQGAPLDFWAVNNYAWASYGSEMRSADFGIAKYQELVGLPVLISETGHSSTENILGPGAAERQPNALPSQLWEALMSGAIGVHFFHWNDRNMFTTNYFLREKGFGIVDEHRIPKQPVYSNVVAILRRMEELKIEDLLGGSISPPRDVLFYWSQDSDMGWPRANQENAMIWGALRRLGYQPGIIDDEQFNRGDYTNASALLLSRAYQLSPSTLETITNRLFPRGIHLHANADLPGQFDAYHQPNRNWPGLMRGIFGLEVASAAPGWDGGSTDSPASTRAVFLRGASGIGDITPAYFAEFVTWKIWHGITASSGKTIVTHTGVNGSQGPMPALQFKDHGIARAAVNTFALGDTYGANAIKLWDYRASVLRAIYQDYFRIEPPIRLSGAGEGYVMPDYRVCRDGSVLISLMNEHTAQAAVVVSAPSLLHGRTVSDLTAGATMLKPDASGRIQRNLSGDGFALLHATSAGTASLVSDRSQILFKSVPTAVWPNGSPAQVQIEHHAKEPGDLRLRLEQVHPILQVRTQSGPIPVVGDGIQQVELVVPDADLADTSFVSSHDGGLYRWVISLEKAGVIVNEASLPLRLLWPVVLRGVPQSPVSGQTYQATLEWQELPSYLAVSQGTPLDRWSAWDNRNVNAEHYVLAINFYSGGRPVATNAYVVSTGSGSMPIKIRVPTGAGPIQWDASVRQAPVVRSTTVVQGFEGMMRGAQWSSNAPPRTNLPPLFSPWFSYVYANPSDQSKWQNEGVNLEGRGGGQAAFLVVTNNRPKTFAGFGLQYDYSTTWVLPADRRAWSNYVFSVDFYEQNRRAALVELQLKNKGTTLRMVHVIQPYQPGPDGWCHLSVTLDRFATPSYSAPFDPTAVSSLVVNVQMFEQTAQYVAFFDNISFVGPTDALVLGSQAGYFSSRDDRETVDDNFVLEIASIQKNLENRIELFWRAPTSRNYGIYVSDDVLFSSPRLLSSVSITRRQQGGEDYLEALDLSAPLQPHRFYRLSSRPLR
ncbi:MAG: beta-galactosidase [Verrucomicrobiales bacterium]|nr:beta-galactosidase [Verrucomicrobiales bacterium]